MKLAILSDRDFAGLSQGASEAWDKLTLTLFGTVHGWQFEADFGNSEELVLMLHIQKLSANLTLETVIC